MQKLNLCNEVLENAIGVHKNCEKCGLEISPLDMVAVQAMEELLQYRAIGTPEECLAAVEKQMAKKPIIINNGIMLNFKCPRCGIERLVGRNAREDYCGECGQLLDWSDEECD